MIKFETGNEALNAESMTMLKPLLLDGTTINVTIDGVSFAANRFQHCEDMMFFTSNEPTVNTEFVRDLKTGYAANSFKRLLTMLNTGQFRVI